MKPTKEMIEHGKKLALARQHIDKNRVYKMQLPTGEVVEYTGEQLIRTGEAFAELIAAGASGNDDRSRAALHKIATIDCND